MIMILKFHTKCLVEKKKKAQTKTNYQTMNITLNFSHEVKIKEKSYKCIIYLCNLFV